MFRNTTNHGPHPGEGRRVSLQEKKKRVCQSTWRAAGRGGPGWTGPLRSGQRTSTLCMNHCTFVSGIITTKLENLFLSSTLHAGVRYRCCFHHSAEISIHFSFPSSIFELESTPHLHLVVKFWYAQFNSVQSLQWVQIRMAPLDLLHFLEEKNVDKSVKRGIDEKKLKNLGVLKKEKEEKRRRHQVTAQE